MKRIHENFTEQTSKTRGMNRGRIELLAGRLNLLTGTDKVLMTMYIQHGNSVRQIARIRGVSETSTARRIRAISKRLVNGPYIDCLRCRDKLTDLQLAVARDYYLKGLSIRRVAEKRCWSYYRVRDILTEIQSILNQPHRRTG